MWTTMDSPLGTVRVVASDKGITAIEFIELTAEDKSAYSSTARAVLVSAGRPVGERVDDHPVLVEAVRQLRAYFDGTLREFDLPLDPGGTAFQRRVWDQLRLIGYGKTASYGEIARSIGMTPAASRAVGMANGRNPIAIVIPCHRVVGVKGSLSGYAGGVERKQVLLDIERGSLF